MKLKHLFWPLLALLCLITFGCELDDSNDLTREIVGEYQGRLFHDNGIFQINDSTAIAIISKVDNERISISYTSNNFANFQFLDRTGIMENLISFEVTEDNRTTGFSFGTLREDDELWISEGRATEIGFLSFQGQRR